MPLGRQRVTGGHTTKLQQNGDEFTTAFGARNGDERVLILGSSRRNSDEIATVCELAGDETVAADHLTADSVDMNSSAWWRPTCNDEGEKFDAGIEGGTSLERSSGSGTIRSTTQQSAGARIAALRQRARLKEANVIGHTAAHEHHLQQQQQRYKYPP